MAITHIELTQLQYRTYVGLVGFVEQHLFQPTQQELAETVQVTRRTVYDVLRQLDQKEFIKMPAGAVDRNVGLPHLHFRAYVAEAPTQSTTRNHSPGIEVSSLQLKTYLYMVRHVEEFGFQPTQQELADFVEVTRRSVYDVLRQLQTKGFVVLPDGLVDRNIAFPYLFCKAHVLVSEA